MAFSGDFMCNDKSKILIRIATSKDAQALAEIYKPFVESTAVSFEYIAPDDAEFAVRINTKLKDYPFLVAEINGEVSGYCYASAFLPRPAYKHSVETTLYIKNGYQNCGIGKKLYKALEELLKLQNVLSLNACIAFADTPDETLNNNSMAFHSKMGYRYVGRFNASGYKFGRFYDMIWMEKLISEPQIPFADFIPFSSITAGAQILLDKINAFNNKTVN